MGAYKPRLVDVELASLMGGLPAIALEGAKGVGKTATAARAARTVYALDDTALLGVMRAEPKRVLLGTPPVLIDEWQYLPETWDLVRRAVDDGAAAGQYLLTGSANQQQSETRTHSGAGRIVTLRMRPLALCERELEAPRVSFKQLLYQNHAAIGGRSRLSLADYAREIVRSGFPGIRQLEGRALRAQLDGYLARLCERDFPEMGHRVRNPTALRRWMAAYAAATSTCASYEKIRDAATGGHGDKPAKSTTLPHRDILERLWIIDPLWPWLPTNNRLTRLSAPPKHHLADPALAARLLRVDEAGLLGGMTNLDQKILLGALFESLVCLTVRVIAQLHECEVKHLRTARGEREIDLVVERADGKIIAIEVKLANTVNEHDVRHLLWLKDRLGDSLLDSLVITTGPEAYRRSDGVGVVPAALLGP